MGLRISTAGVVVLGILTLGRGARGQVVGLHSISQIAQGTRLDFEGAYVHSNPNLVLSSYGMNETSYVYDVTSMTYPVTGNPDAPIGGKALFSFDTISTTTPWESVGLALSTSLLDAGIYTFTFSAYDINHVLLYSDEHVTNVVSGTLAENNANAFFEGLTSTTPVYSFSVTASNPNYVGDNLTFVPVPEPGVGMGMVVLLWRRRRGGGNDEMRKSNYEKLVMERFRRGSSSTRGGRCLRVRSGG